MIRIVDENGQVRFDVNRSLGTLLVNGKGEFYAETREVLFLILHDRGFRSFAIKDQIRVWQPRGSL
jgi:hypothetical protein